MFVDTYLRYLVKCTIHFSNLITSDDNLTHTFYIVSSKLASTISWQGFCFLVFGGVCFVVVFVFVFRFSFFFWGGGVFQCLNKLSCQQLSVTVVPLREEKYPMVPVTWVQHCCRTLHSQTWVNGNSKSNYTKILCQLTHLNKNRAHAKMNIGNRFLSAPHPSTYLSKTSINIVLS